MFLETAMCITRRAEGESFWVIREDNVQGWMDRESYQFLFKVRGWFRDAETHWDQDSLEAGPYLSFYDCPDMFKEVETFEDLVNADGIVDNLNRRPRANLTIIQETMRMLWMIERYLPWEMKDIDSEVPLTGMQLYPYAKLYADMLFDFGAMITPFEGAGNSGGGATKFGRLTHDSKVFARAFHEILPDFYGGFEDMLVKFNKMNMINESAIKETKALDVAVMELSYDMVSLVVMVGAGAVAGKATAAFVEYANGVMERALAVAVEQGVKTSGLRLAVDRAIWKAGEVMFNAEVFDLTFKTGMLPMTGLPGGARLAGKDFIDQLEIATQDMQNSYMGALAIISALYLVPGFVTEKFVGADMKVGMDMLDAEFKAPKGTSWMDTNLKLDPVTGGFADFGAMSSLTSIWKGEISLADAWTLGRQYQSLKLAVTQNPRLGLPGALRWFSTYLVLAEGDLLNKLTSPSPSKDDKTKKRPDPEAKDIAKAKIKTAVTLFLLDLGFAMLPGAEPLSDELEAREDYVEYYNAVAKRYYVEGKEGKSCYLKELEPYATVKEIEASFKAFSELPSGGYFMRQEHQKALQDRLNWVRESAIDIAEIEKEMPEVAGKVKVAKFVQDARAFVKKYAAPTHNRYEAMMFKVELEEAKKGYDAFVAEIDYLCNIGVLRDSDRLSSEPTVEEIRTAYRAASRATHSDLAQQVEGVDLLAHFRSVQSNQQQAIDYLELSKEEPIWEYIDDLEPPPHGERPELRSSRSLPAPSKPQK
jgi:hypothetical protein